MGLEERLKEKVEEEISSSKNRRTLMEHVYLTLLSTTFGLGQFSPEVQREEAKRMGLPENTWTVYDSGPGTAWGNIPKAAAMWGMTEVPKLAQITSEMFGDGGPEATQYALLGLLGWSVGQNMVRLPLTLNNGEPIRSYDPMGLAKDGLRQAITDTYEASLEWFLTGSEREATRENMSELREGLENLSVQYQVGMRMFSDRMKDKVAAAFGMGEDYREEQEELASHYVETQRSDSDSIVPKNRLTSLIPETYGPLKYHERDNN